MPLQVQIHAKYVREDQINGNRKINGLDALIIVNQICLYFELIWFNFTELFVISTYSHKLSRANVDVWYFFLTLCYIK